MVTLKELFDLDFGNTIKVGINFQYPLSSKIIEVEGNISFDFTANCLFTSYYFSEPDLDLNFFINFLNYLHSTNTWNTNGNIKLPNASLLKGLRIRVENTNPLTIEAQFPGEEVINMSDLKYHGRVYIYSESQLQKHDILELSKYGKRLDFHTQFRSPNYRNARQMDEQALAFLSHDSRDKTNIARPLAHKLQSLDCPIWYDEYSLQLGDDLRESIEKGIKECKKCVLILTPNFLQNNGWTKTEFNSIFTRQLIMDEKLILPVWAGIDKKDIYEYSPSLLNVVGVNWQEGIDVVAHKIVGAIKGKQV